MSKRKVHLAGERCGSSYGADPAPTMPPGQYQHLPTQRRCGSCDKKLASLMETALGDGLNGSPLRHRQRPDGQDLTPDLSASASPATKEQQ